jgi:hypothetical protein
MLFPCNALASGPQARFGAKKDLKSGQDFLAPAKVIRIPKLKKRAFQGIIFLKLLVRFQ